MTRTISYHEAVALLASVNTNQPIGFTALTEPEMRKTGNPFMGKARKLSRIHAWIGDYENRVQRQLEREGKGQLTFHAMPRKWGERVSLALVRHVKDGEERFYLSSVPISARPFYLLLTDLGLMPVAKTLFQPFMPETVKPTNQGTEKAIMPRDYDLRGISSFNLGGQSYRIRHA